MCRLEGSHVGAIDGFRSGRNGVQVHEVLARAMQCHARTVEVRPQLFREHEQRVQLRFGRRLAEVVVFTRFV